MKSFHSYDNISPNIFRVRNFLNKSCEENQNTDFMFSNFFPKIVPFMRSCRKCCGAREASNGNMAACCMLDEWGYTRTSTRPRLCTHTQRRASTRTHTPSRARARTHAQKYVIPFAFSRQQYFRECALVLLYTYILYIFFFWCDSWWE